MGRKDKRPRQDGSWSGPGMCGLALTDSTVSVRGIRGNVCVVTLPSGRIALASVAAVMPLRPGEEEAVERELDACTQSGFPEQTVSLFQEVIVRKALEDVRRGVPEPIDAEKALADVVRILETVSPQERASGLASIAHRAGFGTGDVFAFMAALPSDQRKAGA